MKFGLSKSEYNYIYELVVKPLLALGAEVFVFGSRARGDSQPFSDLDLMVEAENDLSKIVFQLRENLTEGNFPIKVDLVQLIDFEEKYLKNYQLERSPFI